MKNKLLSRFNRFDIYLVIIIASLSAGSLGGVFLPFRVITILLIPDFLSTLTRYSRYVKTYTNCTLFFFVYVIVSVVWSPPGNEAMAHLAYCIFHFILFFEILLFSFRAKSPFLSISTGWLIAVALTLVIAMWELTTDNHLSMSKKEGNEAVNLGYTIFMRQFASVTFHNYNTYVTFLCCALPFIFHQLLTKNNFFIQRLLSIVCLVLSTVCIIFNASRGGLIVIVVLAGLYFLYTGKGRKSYLYLLLIGAVVIYALRYFGDALFTMMEVRTAGGALFDGNSRFAIWGHALDAFFKTGGLGVGLGGLKAAISAEWSGISITHNIFLECLVEFGLIIFIGFIVYLVKLVKSARKYADRAEKVTVYMSLLTLPIYGIIDAGFLNSPFVFASFASLSVFANLNRINILRGWKH